MCVCVYVVQWMLFELFRKLATSAVNSKFKPMTTTPFGNSIEDKQYKSPKLLYDTMKHKVALKWNQ